MIRFHQNIEKSLPSNMVIPEAINKLFYWIESKGFYRDDEEIDQVGYLFSEDDVIESWTDDERDGGTWIEFYNGGTEYLDGWFGEDNKELVERLYIFAKTGADGSNAAFWLDDNGIVRIVHMGSGSGSTLLCVLANDAVDFLRLLAIGYDEICWNQEYDRPPPNDNDGEILNVRPNIEYRKWVEETFSVTIPKTASEIVNKPAEMHDKSSDDPFWNWVEENSV